MLTCTSYARVKRVVIPLRKEEEEEEEKEKCAILSHDHHVFAVHSAAAASVK